MLARPLLWLRAQAPFDVVLLLALGLLQLLLFYRVDAFAPEHGLMVDDRWQSLGLELYHSGRYALPGPDGQLHASFASPPVWPLVFALAYCTFGETPAALQAINLLCVAMAFGVVVVAWRFGRLSSPAAGRWAAVFAGLDLSAVYWANSFYTPDVAVGFFAALGLFHVVRWFLGPAQGRDLPWAGVWLALSAWTKPALCLIWLPLAALVALRTRRRGLRTAVSAACALGAIPLLFVAGWSARNWWATGYFAYSSQAGNYLLMWNAAYLLAYQQGVDLNRAGELLVSRFDPDGRSVQMSEGELNANWSRAAKRLLLSSPIDYLFVIARQAPVLYLGTSWPGFLCDPAEATRALAIRQAKAPGETTNAGVLRRAWGAGCRTFAIAYVFVKLHLVGLYAAACLGGFRLAREPAWRWPLATMLVALAANTAVVSPASHDRYRYPTQAVVCALAGCGLARGRGRSGMAIRTASA